MVVGGYVYSRGQTAGAPGQISRISEIFTEVASVDAALEAFGGNRQIRRRSI